MSSETEQIPRSVPGLIAQQMPGNAVPRQSQNFTIPPRGPWQDPESPDLFDEPDMVLFIDPVQPVHAVKWGSRDVGAVKEELLSAVAPASVNPDDGARSAMLSKNDTPAIENVVAIGAQAAAALQLPSIPSPQIGDSQSEGSEEDPSGPLQTNTRHLAGDIRGVSGSVAHLQQLNIIEDLAVGRSTQSAPHLQHKGTPPPPDNWVRRSTGSMPSMLAGMAYSASPANPATNLMSACLPIFNSKFHRKRMLKEHTRSAGPVHSSPTISIPAAASNGDQCQSEEGAGVTGEAQQCASDEFMQSVPGNLNIPGHMSSGETPAGDRPVSGELGVPANMLCGETPAGDSPVSGMRIPLFAELQSTIGRANIINTHAGRWAYGATGGKTDYHEEGPPQQPPDGGLLQADAVSAAVSEMGERSMPLLAPQADAVPAAVSEMRERSMPLLAPEADAVPAAVSEMGEKLMPLLAPAVSVPHTRASPFVTGEGIASPRRQAKMALVFQKSFANYQRSPALASMHRHGPVNGGLQRQPPPTQSSASGDQPQYPTGPQPHPHPQHGAGDPPNPRSNQESQPLVSQQSLRPATSNSQIRGRVITERVQAMRGRTARVSLARVLQQGHAPCNLLLVPNNKVLEEHPLLKKSSWKQVLPHEPTCATRASDGATWVGFENGTVQVEKLGYSYEHQAFNTAVTCITLGENGEAWVGGEGGELRVLKLYGAGVVELLTRQLGPVEPECARVLCTPAYGCLEHLKRALSRSEKADLTVTSICRVGKYMVVAQGQDESACLHLLSNYTGGALEWKDTFMCGQYGDCTCMSAVDMGSGRERLLTGHKNGHVLLWEELLDGPMVPRMMIVPKVQRKTLKQPITGLAICPRLGVLCIGFTRQIQLCGLPTYMDLDLICPGPSPAGRYSVMLPSWSPEAAAIYPHTTWIANVMGAGSDLVTCSGFGTVRCFTECDIQQAMGQALIPVSVNNVPESEIEQLALKPHIIREQELDIITRLGSGSYGKVFRGAWNGIPVAIKIPSPPKPPCYLDSSYAPIGAHTQASINQKYQRELQQMARLNHPLVVRLFGVVPNQHNPDGPGMIVMELCPKGSVHDLLRKAARGQIKLHWSTRLRILHQVACAMHHLHTLPEPVTHGDLRTPNLLIDSNDVVKVADFDSARSLLHPDQRDTDHQDVNPRWCAPEKLVDGRNSRKADVFNFGIISWEVLTCRHPYDHISGSYAVRRKVLRGERPAKPDAEVIAAAPEGFVELMARCWAQNPNQRPEFVDIKAKLQAMVPRG